MTRVLKSEFNLDLEAGSSKWMLLNKDLNQKMKGPRHLARILNLDLET